VERGTLTALRGGPFASFAVGHMSLAYLLGKGSAKLLRVKINIPLLLVLSVLPDADLVVQLLTNTHIHRGPTHSIIVAVLVFIPFFVVYRKRAVPYFLALISHSLIGDFFIGGRVQLFWPLSGTGYGIHQVGTYIIDINTPVDSIVEILLFLAAVYVLYKSGDWKVFFSDDKSNLLLIIPLATVLVPTIIGYQTQPLIRTSPTLALAHLFFLVLFCIAVSKTLARYLRISREKPFVKPKKNG
jgi:membrane-bound metal-dependent hydrolase YbcI (DUF457 family)